MAFTSLDTHENKKLRTTEEAILDGLKGKTGNVGDTITWKVQTDRAITQGAYDRLIGSTLDFLTYSRDELYEIIKITDISVFDNRSPERQMAGVDPDIPDIGDYETHISASIIAAGPLIARAALLRRSLAWAGLSYMGYEVVTNEEAASYVREVAGGIGSSITIPLLLIGGILLLSRR